MRGTGLKAAVAFAFLCTAAVAAAADWPWFQGPTHDNQCSATGRKKTFEQGPKEMWSLKIGDGFSPFAVVDGKLYTCGNHDGKQTVFCIDAKSGKEIWTIPFEQEFKEGNGNGPRSTPTIDDGRLYITSARAKAFCFDLNSQKEIWSQQLGEPPAWGYAASVLIDGDLAIVSAGFNDGALVAYNKKTGEKVWAAGKDRSGHCTPFPFDFEGRRYIACLMRGSAIIVDLKEGKQVWTTRWRSTVNATTPVYHDGYLFITSAYGTGGMLVKLGRDGDALKVTEVWRNKAVECRFNVMVLSDGYLYGQMEGCLACVDFMTGETKWRTSRPNWGSELLADGYVIFLSAKGDLEIGKPDPKAWYPVTKARPIEGKCWTPPTLCDGRLYIRNMDTVKCLDMTQ